MNNFRILIAPTEKTGNTWLKLLLAQIYDLPTPYISDSAGGRSSTLLRLVVSSIGRMPQRTKIPWQKRQFRY